ncbi:hypothetical protein Cflav_PD5397 [Pedosphaera parvula Ellin514]|uniref:Uncharacterized protein n=1 Tax=Pedosphaera parvula (strain Ellin514) TaxID=320771 RepID=B9XB77_PEDPL|nr:hypothetical protein Cflav_PD5397 [Pedosphaera parvula Ellin514]
MGKNPESQRFSLMEPEKLVIPKSWDEVAILLTVVVQIQR